MSVTSFENDFHRCDHFALEEEEEWCFLNSVLSKTKPRLLKAEINISFNFQDNTYL